MERVRNKGEDRKGIFVLNPVISLIVFGGGVDDNDDDGVPQ